MGVVHCCAKGAILRSSDSASQHIAEALSSSMTPGPRVGILGSTTFHSKMGPPLCAALGKSLAEAGLVLVTGGNYRKNKPTVQQTVASAFHKAASDPPNVLYHLCPSDSKHMNQWRFGEVMVAGKTGAERGAVLARMCTAYILVEGGNGAALEGQAVLDIGNVLIPVACTGGAASGMFWRDPLRLRSMPDTTTWPAIDPDDWKLVTNFAAAPIEELTSAIVRLVLAVSCHVFSI